MQSKDNKNWKIKSIIAEFKYYLKKIYIYVYNVNVSDGVSDS